MKYIRNVWIFLLFLLSLILSTGALGADDADGMTLRIGTPNLVKSPSLVGDYYMGIFAHLSNPPLMRVAEDGTLEGQTAEMYEVSDDGKTWKFYIDDDLYWSDGTKVTPDDVKFTIEYYTANSVMGWLVDLLEEVSVTDDNAVVIELSEPYATLNQEFVTYNILPKHVWEDIDDPKEYTNEGEYVGCGPFYIKGTALEAGVLYFEKNPHWKGTQPNIDSVEVHMYSNMDVLSIALKRGDVDAYYKYGRGYPYANVRALEEDTFDFVVTDYTGLTFLGMNIHKEPFSDVSFREAISYAIDYDEIERIVALGYGGAANRGFVPRSMAYFKETERLEYDSSNAKEILDDAGYVDLDGDGLREDLNGDDMELVLLIRSGDMDYQRIAELLKEYLGNVGIDVEIRMVERSTWFDLKDEYNYDMTVTGTTPWGMWMWANWGTGYFDSRRTGRGVLHTIDDPEFHALCDNIMSTTDEGQLEEYAHDVQDYYAENLPGIALYWGKYVTPYNDDWTGWSSDPIFGIYRLDTFLNVEKA